METIIILIIVLVILYFIFHKKKDKKQLFKKYISSAKKIDNINKHLRIADASQNLYEVRIHARKAMNLIKKYGLVDEYRKILKNK